MPNHVTDADEFFGNVTLPDGSVVKRFEEIKDESNF